jgi:hypothetical protein
MLRRLRRLLVLPALLLVSSQAATEPALRVAAKVGEFRLTESARRPDGFRYSAFPSVLRAAPDEVLIAFKAGRSHATDAGAAMEVVRHTLSTGATQLVQRLVAPVPKLYQMGEWSRFPDSSLALYLDVQGVGWDGRHYRTGAEMARWDPARGALGPVQPLPPIGGVLYGYPLDFVHEGKTTWHLSMAFGYHLPGGRWSVDALRSDDSGRSWRLVRNLAEEFGGLRINESGLARHGSGFLVATRGYDRIARLHRTDGEFRMQRQVDLSGRHPHIHDVIGRPRLFVRDGQGYLIGRNWTKGDKGRTAAGNPMQLCLIRFDPESLEVNSVVVLDNAERQPVSDGYYAAAEFSGEGEGTRMHVITYKATGGQPPDLVRYDYRWADVK